MPDEDEPVPMRRGVRIGVDAGQVRVGLATSDPEGMLATPHSTIRRSRSADGVAQIAQLVRQTWAIEVRSEERRVGRECGSGGAGITNNKQGDRYTHTLAGNEGT